MNLFYITKKGSNGGQCPPQPSYNKLTSFSLNYIGYKWKEVAGGNYGANLPSYIKDISFALYVKHDYDSEVAGGNYGTAKHSDISL